VTSALSRRPGVAAVAGALTIAFSAILVKLADVEPSTAAIFRCASAGSRSPPASSSPRT
jgi:hypothetical protein